MRRLRAWRWIFAGGLWLVLIEPDDMAGERRPTVSASIGGNDACVVPINTGTVRVRVTDATRRACVSRARLIEHEVPVITDDALRAGPPSRAGFTSADDIYCRLRPMPKRGGSLKFRCMHTDSANRLYDDDGDLVPDAASVDADGNLLNARGVKLLKPNGNPREGNEFRVKYFRGEWPEVRYREMFTETVVSRLFWALGIPVDRVYLAESVRCFGCSADPFGQMTPEQSDTARQFNLAAVKRPYPGRKISVVRNRGFLGLGSRYDHGWGFNEVGRMPPPGGSLSQRIEAEVLALALTIVAYHNLHSFQNDLRCRPGAWDTKTGACSEPVAYVSDVGGTLGGARAHWVKGDEEPEMMLHPRGDYITFSQSRVFDDARRCVLRQAIGEVSTVSEAARQLLDDRIRGRLGREQLRIIFEQAYIHRVDQRVNELVAERLNVRPGPDLDRAVQLLWADEIERRFTEVLNTKCPA